MGGGDSRPHEPPTGYQDRERDVDDPEFERASGAVERDRQAAGEGAGVQSTLPEFEDGERAAGGSGTRDGAQRRVERQGGGDDGTAGASDKGEDTPPWAAEESMSGEEVTKRVAFASALLAGGAAGAGIGAGAEAASTADEEVEELQEEMAHELWERVTPAEDQSEDEDAR